MVVRSSSFISNPVVACGIIVYNQREYIANCIDKMLKQDCDFTFTIVIADDCSTDGTQNILKEYQERFPEKIKLVLNERNLGIAGNWVSCCRAMEGGRFVSFCDGDDYWSNPKKLQIQVEFLSSHPSCVAVSTDFDELDQDREKIVHDVRKNNPPITGMVQQDLWSAGKAMSCWSTYMFKKNIFDEKIPFQAFIDSNFPFQDWPTFVIMAAYGEFQYIPISTCVYRKAKGSDSHAIDINKLLLRQERSKTMCKYLASLFPDLRQDSDEERDRYIALTMISICILNNKYKLAKGYARKSGVRNIRYWCCQTWITFQLFRILKIISSRRKELHRLH